ncbi:MAG: amidohydrolase [Pedosphaera sp.]|nr:amidohydrolase [Pedosphaera sp.]
MQITRRRFLGQAVVSGAVAAAGCVTLPASRGPLIIDTHQHLWDLKQQKLPWLATAPEVLRKNYRTEEYLAATAGLNLRSIYMEVDVATEELGNEATLILGIASGGKTPMLAAVIGGRPDATDFEAYLRRFSVSPHLKGVRRVLHSDATPAGYCLKPEFVRGVKLLGAAGKSFDLCMRATDLMDGVSLAKQCPQTRFVLDHCGNPDLKCFRAARTGEAKPTHTADAWKSSIDAFAKLPNVIGKISGIAASLPKGGGTGDLAPAVNHCLDAFGPDRVVFGGDWPVCLLGATYKHWVEMLSEIISSRPAEQQRKLWATNALRHYSLTV